MSQVLHRNLVMARIFLTTVIKKESIQRWEKIFDDLWCREITNRKPNLETRDFFKGLIRQILDSKD